MNVWEKKKKINLRAHLASNGRLAAIGKGLLGLLGRTVLGGHGCRGVYADGDATILLVVLFSHGRETLAFLFVERIFLTSTFLFSVPRPQEKKTGGG